MKMMKSMAVAAVACLMAVGAAVAGPAATATTSYEMNYSLGTFGNSAGYTGKVTFEMWPVTLYQAGLTDAFVAEAGVSHGSSSYPPQWKDQRVSSPLTVFSAIAGVDDIFGSGLATVQWFDGAVGPGKPGTLRGIFSARAAIGGTTSTRGESNGAAYVVATLGPYTAMTVTVNSMQTVGYADMPTSQSTSGTRANTYVELNTGTLRADGTYQLGTSPVRGVMNLVPESVPGSKSNSEVKTVRKPVYNNSANPVKVLIYISGGSSASVGPN